MDATASGPPGARAGSRSQPHLFCMLSAKLRFHRVNSLSNILMDVLRQPPQMLRMLSGSWCRGTGGQRTRRRRPTGHAGPEA